MSNCNASHPYTLPDMEVRKEHLARLGSSLSLSKRRGSARACAVYSVGEFHNQNASQEGSDVVTSRKSYFGGGEGGEEEGGRARVGVGVVETQSSRRQVRACREYMAVCINVRVNGEGGLQCQTVYCEQESAYGKVKFGAVIRGRTAYPDHLAGG